jgi:hypothetical protein
MLPAHAAKRAPRLLEGFFAVPKTGAPALPLDRVYREGGISRVKMCDSLCALAFAQIFTSIGL